MKKKLFGLAFLPLCMLIGGCSPNKIEIARENLSEVTNTYFYNSCEEFSVAISSGNRENPYVYDGKSCAKVNFALVEVKMPSKKERESFVFSIDGDAFSVNLEYNFMTDSFMVDLERELHENAAINMKYGNTQISVPCVSNEFQINCERALEIGMSELAEEFDNMMVQGKFQGECYLKILDNFSKNNDERFWCFSLVNTKGEHINCVIDVNNGEVVART